MPPRFAYWTILIDGQPTAFRARDREELLPTLAQLKRTNQDVLLRWFARGKLWESPDAERATEQRGREAGAPRGKDAARGRDWRPGGQHKDPRQQFRDQKKQRNQERRAERHARREGDADGRRGGKQGGTPASQGERRPWTGKPREQKPWGKPREQKPWAGKPRERKPWSDKPPEQKPRAGNAREQKPWSGNPRAQTAWANKPRENKPWADKRGGGKPQSPRSFKPAPGGDRKPWSGKPRGKFPPRDVRTREDEAPRRSDEQAPPPKRRESPDNPPAPEQIVIKPEPPERG